MTCFAGAQDNHIGTPQIKPDDFHSGQDAIFARRALPSVATGQEQAAAKQRIFDAAGVEHIGRVFLSAFLSAFLSVHFCGFGGHFFGRRWRLVGKKETVGAENQNLGPGDAFDDRFERKAIKVQLRRGPPDLFDVGFDRFGFDFRVRQPLTVGSADCEVIPRRALSALTSG